MQKSEHIEILQVITALDVGGAERVVLELSNGLEESAKSVGIVHLLNQTKILEQYKFLNYPIFNLMVNRNNFLSLIMGFFKLNRIVREYSVKVIHAHMFHALLISVFIKIFNPRIKLVFTSHNFKGFSSIRKLLIQFAKKIRDVDIVFSANQHININAKNTIVIPNGVQERQAKTYHKCPDKKFIFINVASLTEQKNHQLLINEFYKLKDYNVELWLLGDGVLKENIVNQINALDLNSKIKLLGIQENINYFLEQADCFVLSSKWEGLPMAVLEASMIGLPIITTPVGALKDIINEENGFLAEEESLNLFMKYVYENIDFSNRKALKLRNLVLNNFSKKNMVIKHLNIYKSLVE